MQLFVYWTLLLSFLIPGSCDLKTRVENFGANANHRLLNCLEILINVTDWLIDDFLVIFNDPAVIGDDFFKRRSNFSWKLHSLRKSSNATGYFNVIILTEDFYTLNETLEAISIRDLDGRGKFVIGVTEDFESLDDIRRSSTGAGAVMWNLDKTRVVYLVPCNREVLLMTYFPFTKNCQPGELEVLDTWTGNNFEKKAELFPEKMLDIHGCAQNHSVIFDGGIKFQIQKEFTETGALVAGGVGGKLMTIIAEGMNMKLQLLPETPKSWESMLLQIIRGESLLVVGGIIPTPDKLEHFNLDSEYMQESFGFGYLADGLDISWKNFVRPLRYRIWACIGFIFPLFCGLIYTVSRYHRRVIGSDKFTILDTFAIFIGNCRVLPRSYFGRYLFGIWIAYAYLMNAFYNCGLVSYLTTPNEKRVIKTLEDLLADGIAFGGGSWHREFYNDPSDAVMLEIYNNFQIWSVNESGRCLTSGECATGTVTSSLNNYYGNSDPQLRMLEEKAFTFHTPVCMRRGSPFTVGVNRYTSQALERGLVYYWMRYYTRAPFSETIGGRSPIVISTRHLRGILYLYVVGLILSSVLFIGELIFHNYFSNR